MWRLGLIAGVAAVGVSTSVLLLSMHLAPKRVVGSVTGKAVGSNFTEPKGSNNLSPIREMRAEDIFEIYLVPSRPVSLHDCDYPEWQEEPNFPDVKFPKPKSDFESLGEAVKRKVPPFSHHTSHVPPKFPPRFLQGKYSGYCKLKFDISVNGEPANVEAIICTDEKLRAVSINSVLTWRFNPLLKNGTRQSKYAEERFIRFDVSNGRGNILPLPPGF